MDNLNQQTSQTLLDNLKDLLDEIPPPTRNSRCMCGSGLKYKKCCLNPPMPATLHFESMAITSDPLSLEASQDPFPQPFDEDQQLFEDLYYTYADYPEEINAIDCEYFKKANFLRTKYPGNPRILNFLAKGYEILKEEDKMREITLEAYEKFPNYLFAQAARANLYIEEGLPEKALEALNGAHTLKQLYPNRSVFHISELKAFEDVMIRYYCATSQLRAATIHLKILKQTLEPDDALLQYATQLVKRTCALGHLIANLPELDKTD